MTAKELKNKLIKVNSCHDIAPIILGNWYLKSNILKDFSVNVSFREMEFGPKSEPNFYGTISAVFHKAVSEIDLKRIFGEIGVDIKFVTWSSSQDSHTEGKVGRPNKSYNYICIVKLDSSVWVGLAEQHCYDILKNSGEEKFDSPF